MPFYTGKSADGSDAREVSGAFVNEAGTEWGSEPYPHQKKEKAIMDEIKDYADGKLSIQDIYDQIIVKTCPLSVRCRKYVIEWIIIE